MLVIKRNNSQSLVIVDDRDESIVATLHMLVPDGISVRIGIAADKTRYSIYRDEILPEALDSKLAEHEQHYGRQS